MSGSVNGSSKLGRRAWFDEEMAQIGSDSLRHRSAAGVAARSRALPIWIADRQRLARSLAAWREQRAMNSNRPRGWILPDAALRDLVFQVPRDRRRSSAWASCPRASARTAARSCSQLISAAAVPHPRAAAPAASPPRSGAPRTVQRLAISRAASASELGLAPELLATRRDLERLAGGERDGAPLSGWRRGAIGAELLKAL